MNVFSTPTRRIVAIEFLLMFALQSVYFVGVIGSATYTLHAGAADVALITLSLNACLVAGNAVAGPVIETIGPRRTLLGVFALCALSGVAAWLLPMGFALPYFSSMTNGLLFGVGTTAIDAYPRFFSADAGELARMNGLNQVAVGAAVIAGPALAGWITTWAPTQAVFVLLAVTPLPAIALTWATREQLTAAEADGRGENEHSAERADERAAERAADHYAARETVDEKGAALATVVEGVRIVFCDDGLRTLFLIGFFGFFAYGAFDSLESLFYRDVLRVGTGWMGWLSAVSGIGGMLGSMLVLKIPKEHFSLRLLAAILVLVGVGSMLYTGTPFVLVAAVGQVVTGIGFGALAPVRTTLTQRRSDPTNIGRVTSVMRVGMNSAGVLPLLAAPALASAFGVQAVLFGASTFAALVGVWYLVRVRL